LQRAQKLQRRITTVESVGRPNWKGITKSCSSSSCRCWMLITSLKLWPTSISAGHR